VHPEEPSTIDRIEGIDLMGTAVVLRLERRRESATGKYSVARVMPHVQVFVTDSSMKVIVPLACSFWNPLGSVL
jgi:hypothetical protein